MKGKMPASQTPRIRMELETFIGSMRSDGKAFGARARVALRKQPLPEPVREGNTRMSEERKAELERSERIGAMRRLGLVNPDNSAYTWEQFFGRSEAEIKARSSWGS